MVIGRLVWVAPEVDCTVIEFPPPPPPLPVTVSVTVVVSCVLPLVPVTVIGYVPVGVLAPTVIVMLEVPEPGAGIVAGLKLTVVPDGTPDADKLMAPLKPPLIVEVMVELP